MKALGCCAIGRGWMTLWVNSNSTIYDSMGEKFSLPSLRTLYKRPQSVTILILGSIDDHPSFSFGW